MGVYVEPSRPLVPIAQFIPQLQVISPRQPLLLTISCSYFKAIDTKVDAVLAQYGGHKIERGTLTLHDGMEFWNKLVGKRVLISKHDYKATDTDPLNALFVGVDDEMNQYVLAEEIHRERGSESPITLEDLNRRVTQIEKALKNICVYESGTKDVVGDENG